MTTDVFSEPNQPLGEGVPAAASEGGTATVSAGETKQGESEDDSDKLY